MSVSVLGSDAVMAAGSEVGFRRNLSLHHGFGEGRLTTPKPDGICITGIGPQKWSSPSL
jgi:hypothetical protein